MTTSTPATSPPNSYGISRTRHTERGDRSALFTFLTVLTISIPLLLYWGRLHWFYVDDWDFLAERSISNIGDLFRSHYGHWTTIPIIIYRALFGLVGLHHYWPYQLVVIGLHLTVAILLRVIACRAGVRPWLATIWATLFVFLYAGKVNFLEAFQMTLVGSLVLGLTQIILVDHEGPIDRRDVFGLCAGLGALMFSGVAIPVIAAVGFLVLLRRGWRLAALQTVPLALVYFAWLQWSPTPHDNNGINAVPSVHNISSFIWIGFRSAFSALGFVPAAGLLIFLLTIVGVIQCWRSNRQNLVVPGAVAVGALLFLLVIALTRSAPPPGLGGVFYAATTGANAASKSRYVYVYVALLLPLLMVAFEALAAKWWWSRALLSALLVLTAAVNIYTFQQLHTSKENAGRFQSAKNLISSIPALPDAWQLPRSAQPMPWFFGPRSVTVGWVLDNADKITIITPTPADAAKLKHRLLKQAPPP